MNKSTFCINPFVGFEIRTNGYVAPCCKFNIDFTDRNDLNISDTSLETIRNSDLFQSVKDHMNQGKMHPGCSYCYNEEQSGMYSKRMRDNENFIDIIETKQFENVKLIDLKLGNLCNLKCMICSPGASSKWFEEQTRWEGPKLAVEKNYSKKYRWFEKQSFWDELKMHYHTITDIGLYGGEPFLIKSQFDFLKDLIRTGHSKNIVVSYSTNGTVFPENDLKLITENFKSVNIMLSLDGIENTFEYCRYPAKWKDVSSNLMKFRSLTNTMLTISYSVSMFSVFNIPESLKYYSELNQSVWINLVHDHSSIRELPEDIKNIAIDKLSNINKDYLNILTEDNFSGISKYIKLPPKLDFKNILERIKYSDRYRNNSLVDIIPEIKLYYGNS
jgi:MoaA/NifB/PqqE/SkfB family radical SAM enzyme